MTDTSFNRFVSASVSVDVVSPIENGIEYCDADTGVKKEGGAN